MARQRRPPGNTDADSPRRCPPRVRFTPPAPCVRPAIRLCHSGRCDARPWWLVFESRDGSITAGRRAATRSLVGCWIRHVTEKSSETMGNGPKTFRYSWRRPMGNLLKNPRFPKGTQVLTKSGTGLRSCPEVAGSNPAPATKRHGLEPRSSEGPGFFVSHLIRPRGRSRRT